MIKHLCDFCGTAHDAMAYEVKLKANGTYVNWIGTSGNTVSGNAELELEFCSHDCASKYFAERGLPKIQDMKPLIAIPYFA